MALFEITLDVNSWIQYEIEADNEDDAIEAAYEAADNAEVDWEIRSVVRIDAAD